MNTAAKSPASPSVYITFSGIVIWTAEAAREHVRICRLRGEPTDARVGMGLWQAFQAKWPKETFVGDRDLAIIVMTATYRSVIDALEQEAS